jgi:hypothetical protein
LTSDHTFRQAPGSDGGSISPEAAKRRNRRSVPNVVEVPRKASLPKSTNFHCALATPFSSAPTVLPSRERRRPPGHRASPRPDGASTRLVDGPQPRRTRQCHRHRRTLSSREIMI